MDNIYAKKTKLLINLEVIYIVLYIYKNNICYYDINIFYIIQEPIMAFHIIDLKSDDDNNQKSIKNHQFSFNEINIRTTPKNLNSNALMIIG